MAISKVGIANLALSHIGVDITIESFSEQTKAARLCNRWYDHAREECLEIHNWSFARKRLDLSLHADDPPGTWGFRYQYPSDSVKVREIENPIGPTAPAIPYEVLMSNDGNSKSILCDLEDAAAIYTFDQQNTALFTRYFISTLSFLLAKYMAFPITGKRSIVADTLKQYQAWAQYAPANDANENVDKGPKDADWITARDGLLGRNRIR